VATKDTATFRYIPCGQVATTDVVVIVGNSIIVCAENSYGVVKLSGDGFTILGGSCEATTSTTTSSTTSTTSTTTTSVPCTCYTIINEGSTNSVQYTNCAGNVITESVPAGTTVYRCTRNTPVALGGTFTIFECNPVVNCTANVQCFDCGATPTTSSTTTAID
jgi:hypothetical protein